MCLIAVSEIKEAKRAISCYKILNKQQWNRGALVSPYQYAPYEIGETKTVSHFTDSAKRRIIKRKRIKYVFAGLHAFTRRKDALQERLSFQVVVRCSIPKGTPYILGTDHEIVALKLTVKEIVKK